jgi:hypothetical protein
MTPEIGTFKTVYIWKRTGELRQRMHVCDLGMMQQTPILEQAWICEQTGETEWRRVPIVKQCDCEQR